ncbi:MAG: hypothetical protein WDW38_001242 [Sanguina aurantia]
MAVYIGWSSIHDDATVSGGNQDAYGGMDNTFDAYNGCPNRKWVHLGLQTAGMGFMITGLIAIVQSKQNTADQLQTAADYEAAKSIAAGGSPRVMDTQPVMMWSVHSWVSTATLLVYVLQYFSGLTIFVFYRKSMTAQNMAYFSARHRLLGKMTVFALLGCCMLGWTDMQMCLNDGQEKSYSSAQLLSSASGVVYLLLGGAMAFVWFAPVMEDEAFNKPTQYMCQQSEGYPGVG